MWKLRYLAIFFGYFDWFQKNLIVWKQKNRKPYTFWGARVSEELNSVETVSCPRCRSSNSKVSEELNSVETM